MKLNQFINSSRNPQSSTLPPPQEQGLVRVGEACAGPAPACPQHLHVHLWTTAAQLSHNHTTLGSVRPCMGTECA